MSFLQKAARLLRIGKSRYIVGTDLAGNSYLELPSLSESTDPRHTRRSIQWKEKKEWGDYDQKSIPVQWVMWLRHTRRDPPSIEELVRDRERILTTQANAAKLTLEDQQRKEREAQARIEEQQEAQERAQKLIQTSSKDGIPTSTVVDEQVEAQAGERIQQQDVGGDGVLQQERQPDQDVWAASRARLAAKGQADELAMSPELQQAMQRRAARRAGRNDQDAELERARREMSKSPLDAFVPMPKARK